MRASGEIRDNPKFGRSLRVDRIHAAKPSIGVGADQATQ